eukprot:Blabericola_migrator_1__7574@NODE_386_length_9117_cov_178_340884_g309_i0_p1_GENE_NODE_386_length_9117_cov_178_340884_g309_i0NODE_386_length_9117_cov_178_340884_g309_i0_p1_ORF_typecomplete_len923_score100_53_NODE_386_length_9117_cov_178_340884_g309_i02853053
MKQLRRASPPNSRLERLSDSTSPASPPSTPLHLTFARLLSVTRNGRGRSPSFSNLSRILSSRSPHTNSPPPDAPQSSKTSRRVAAKGLRKYPTNPIASSVHSSAVSSSLMTSGTLASSVSSLPRLGDCRQSSPTRPVLPGVHHPTLQASQFLRRGTSIRIGMIKRPDTPIKKSPCRLFSRDGSMIPPDAARVEDCSRLLEPSRLPVGSSAPIASAATGRESPSPHQPFHKRRFKFPPPNYIPSGPLRAGYPAVTRESQTQSRRASKASRASPNKGYDRVDVTSPPKLSYTSGLYGIGRSVVSAAGANGRVKPPIPVSIEMPPPLTDAEKIQLRLHQKNAMGLRLERYQGLAAMLHAKADVDSTGVLRSCRFLHSWEHLETAWRLRQVFRPSEPFKSEYEYESYIPIKIAPDIRRWAESMKQTGVMNGMRSKNDIGNLSAHSLQRTPSTDSTRAPSSGRSCRIASPRARKLNVSCWGCSAKPRKSPEEDFVVKKNPASALPGVTLSPVEFRAFEAGCLIRPPHPVTLDSLRANEAVLFGHGTALMFILARSWAAYEPAFSLEEFSKHRDGSLMVGAQRSVLNRLFKHQTNLRDLHDMALQDLATVVPYLNLHQLTFLRKQLPSGARLSGRDEIRNFVARLDSSINECVCGLVCEREGLKVGVSIFQRLQSTLVKNVPFELKQEGHHLSVRKRKRSSLCISPQMSEDEKTIVPLRKLLTKWDKQSIGRRLVTMFGALLLLKEESVVKLFVGESTSWDQLDVRSTTQTWWFVPVKDLMKVHEPTQGRSIARLSHLFVQFPALIGSRARPPGELIYTLRSSLPTQSGTDEATWDLRQLPVLGVESSLEPSPTIREALSELMATKAFKRMHEKDAQRDDGDKEADKILVQPDGDKGTDKILVEPATQNILQLKGLYQPLVAPSHSLS